MLITVLFGCFVALAMMLALLDWRRGWLLAVLCGLLQDPARKLTPGTPVAMTFSIVLVYLMTLVAAQRELQADARDIARRFPSLMRWAMIVLLFIILAAINGVTTYGLDKWAVPALSLFIYMAPIPVLVLGYAFPRNEEQIYQFFRFYVCCASVALIGTVLEYLNVRSPLLGLVGQPGDFLRYITGYQIRMLSGFFRAPDIMGWHAAMVTSLSLALALRATSTQRRAWGWIGLAGWGFLNCLISGRRKAVYFVLAYALVFMWRYLRRLKLQQVVSILAAAAVMALVTQRLSSDEQGTVYTRGAATSRLEVYQRLEGGVFETIQQFGIMGAGLGTATQGVRHLLGTDWDIGWQEGGLGKLTVELGVPGLIAALAFSILLFQMLLRLTAHEDTKHSSQLTRAILFSIFAANVVNFMASAQAYSDAVLTLVSAFCLGMLLATASFDDRAATVELLRREKFNRLSQRPGLISTPLPGSAG
ncbi:MAG: hypothetical protein JWN02_2729 [Acidobacteria bacterium]|nr:hypothetical protein [Acidobacteriota bacterium]